MPRKLERRPLIYHLKVLNSDTRELFGFLGNITEKGVLLFCPRAVTLDKLFPLELTLPVPVNGTLHIPFSGTSVWCKRDRKLRMYAVGFEIKYLGLWGRKLIAETIAQMGGKQHALRKSRTE